MEEKSFLDRWGMGLSIFCLIHCLASPLFILSLPFVVTAYLYHPWFHLLLALFIVPIGFYAFIKGYRQHRQRWIPILGGIGMTSLTMVALTPLTWDNRTVREYFIAVVSLVLIVAHYANWRAIQKNTRT